MRLHEKKGAVINDPARGRVTVSMKEFDQAFTGVVIMFEKNDDFEAGGEKHSVMNFAKKTAAGEPGLPSSSSSLPRYLSR